MKDATAEMMMAWISATDDKKERALKLLRGEDETSNPGLSERYLTARELSRTLGLSVQSIWRYSPPFHLGHSGKKRYVLSEVKRYLDSPEFKAVADRLRRERRASYRRTKIAS